jgi:hypothetical protein
MAKAKKSSPKAKPGKAAKLKEAKSKAPAAARKVKEKAVELASNPVVAEIVAAALVAAAAAIKDPKKARAIAASAGEELGEAAKGAAGGGGAMWQLAMDVANRSIKALGTAESKLAKPEKKKKKPKAD